MPYFLWTIKRDVVDYHSLSCDQMLNHYGKTASFTTKVRWGGGAAGGQVQGSTSSPAAPWLSLGGRVWTGRLLAPPQEDLRPGRGRCPLPVSRGHQLGSTHTARAPGTLGPVSSLWVHRPNLRRGGVGGLAASRARINSVSRGDPGSQGEPGHLPCTGPFGCSGAWAPPVLTAFWSCSPSRDSKG